MLLAQVILYRTTSGLIVSQGEHTYRLAEATWDELVNRDNLAGWLHHSIAQLQPMHDFTFDHATLLAPVGGRQEVWAAGVTYYRSRDARMEEAEQAGGGTFYDRVYSAQRPELFFKASPHRVVGPGQAVRIRRDSNWNVPEPELTCLVTSSGKIAGYTIGNDMSSRDIEGENPLYLPQAKVYDGCCALGPGILVTDQMLPPSTTISMTIRREGSIAFQGQTTLAALKRDPAELVSYLFRECSFPHGCLLLTGTGIIPPTDFTLHEGDVVSITIDGIGTLTNPVAR
jgi:2-dehydro-3-deoxy-D-arabinonate dehydratase